MATTQRTRKDVSTESNDNYRTGKYGVPVAALHRVRNRHLGFNSIAKRELDGSLLERRQTEHDIDQGDPVPDDPVGTYRHAHSDRLIDVGQNKHGWYVTRDHETHEPNPIEPGRVKPAIRDRYLVPVAPEDTTDESDNDVDSGRGIRADGGHSERDTSTGIEGVIERPEQYDTPHTHDSNTTDAPEATEDADGPEYNTFLDRIDGDLLAVIKRAEWNDETETETETEHAGRWIASDDVVDLGEGR